MIYVLYTLHVILCLFLILVVLLQQGKGADLSVFGGGATMTAFGARSATNLLHRLTVAGFVGFVLTTLSIAYVKGNVEGGSVMRDVGTAPASEAPVSPGEAAGETTAPAAEPVGQPAPEAGTEPAGDAETNAPEVPVESPAPAAESGAPEGGGS